MKPGTKIKYYSEEYGKGTGRIIGFTPPFPGQEDIGRDYVVKTKDGEINLKEKQVEELPEQLELI